MLKRFINDTKKYMPYALQSAKAQLKGEVANSYLNWIWWVLEPICFALIFYLVFGSFFKLKEDYMLAFILIGVSLWDFFNRMMVNAVTLMRSHKSIVSRIYLPKHILIFERIFVNGFKMCISMGLAVIAMIIEGVQFTWRLVFIIPVFLVFLMFNFGMSCFLLHFGVFVADLYNIVNIVLRMLFYVTGVFYNIYTRLPAPWGRILTNVNPVSYAINALRNVMMHKITLQPWALLGWFAISLVLCITGVLLVYKNENTYVKSI